ncbi:Cysteine desulfurase / Selenide, water dikinase [Spironucleus salmonicida]|uniref:Selenide, water dikinase n=1 Tax=Spironucleus salmonicida TaxID=348837 RepID=V6LJ68_9EUKA|nr:Cysteine desulfurase / Selenide, water dikinase [Spironucleus salmonicida]|eukprot:EST43726.1 Selenide, water dikinase [Spironucleus salmonicida]
MPIYLDHNGTTPMCQEVCDEMSKLLQIQDGKTFCFGNPSSAHIYGFQAKEKLEESRKHVADLFNISKDFVYFTSGGTESNNMVIIGLSQLNEGREIISGPCEHPSIEEPIIYAKRAYSVKHKILNCLKTGEPDVAQLESLLSPQTFLVTTMLAQNEIGTLTDTQEMYYTIKSYNEAHGTSILFHVDASQAVGKTAVAFCCDLMTIAPHKFYGPRGIGCLLSRQRPPKIAYGAPQERSCRPGTENLLAIVGMAKACEVAGRDLQVRVQSSCRKVQKMYDVLQASNLDFAVNGAAGILLENGKFASHFSQNEQICISNTLSVSFRNCPANSIISSLADSVCISAGAACHSDRIDISQTLKSIGLDQQYAMGTIRISVGEFVSLEEAEIGIQKIIQVVKYYQSGNMMRLDELSALTSSLQPENSVKSEEIVLQNVELQIEKYPDTVQNSVALTESCPVISKTQNLLNLTSGLGCACKLRPQALSRVLQSINFGKDPNILVSQATADDACVYQLDNQLLVSTTDFFSPVIDDAYLFGKISAANALSDVYAMNSKPIFAIAIAGFPSNRMSEDSMIQVIQGAVDKCQEAGIVISGGHTIESIEPFFGLCVNGIQNRIEKIKLNRIEEKVCQNDIYLVMTKKLGVGMLTTAMKRGLIQNRQNYKEIYDELVWNMETLNIIKQELPDQVVALTDITGFGLAGHLSEMLIQDGLSAEIYTKSIPVLKGVQQIYDLYQKIVLTNENNKIYVANNNFKLDDVPFFTDLVTDATTSGGLLFAVKGWNTATEIADLYDGTIIGHVFKSDASQQILLTDDKARENVQRGIGFFK